MRKRRHSWEEGGPVCGVGVGGGPVMKDMEGEPGCRGHSSEELGSGTLVASTKGKPPTGLEVIGGLMPTS